jgi:hypothetical protein
MQILEGGNMIRRLAVAIAAASALSVALTGCGSSDNNAGGSGSGGSSSANSGASGGGSGDAVAWAEKVCKSVEGDVASLSKTPDIDQSDPAKAKDGMVAYLGGLATALGHMASGIKDAGAPPVADGAQAVTKVTDALEQAKNTVEQAKDNLDKASVTDQAAFQAAFQKVGEDLSKLGDLEDPTKDLESDQTMKDAFQQAPTCKKLDESTGSGSTSSAPTS